MSILITGGTGSFGVAFAKKLLELGWSASADKIILYSRGEFRQFEVAQELASLDKAKRLRFLIGDVRDVERLKRAMDGVGSVVHAAALKRIEVGHYNPVEMVKTNVGGAVNLIEAAQSAGVKKVVAISSDKAFEPVSPYGTSKALAESLFLAANNTTGWGGTKFAVCRYGNVWNSRGSIVPVWKDMIAKGRVVVPVTDPECTRFFMRMDEAADLVLNTWRDMPGEVAIPELPAYRIADLAEAMGVKMHVIGLPPYEKLHESMKAGCSSDQARRMTVDELKKELQRV